jgi:hypothetical protein
MGLCWWLSWVPLTRVLVTLLFTTPHRILRQHTLLEILRRRYAAGDAEEYLGARSSSTRCAARRVSRRPDKAAPRIDARQGTWAPASTQMPRSQRR